MANTSILAAFERMWQHVVAALGNKADASHSHSITELEDYAQPDWNQNDETAVDYVKNRTHWIETEDLELHNGTLLFEEISFDAFGTGDTVYSSDSIVLKGYPDAGVYPGSIFITINDNKYECPLFVDSLKNTDGILSSYKVAVEDGGYLAVAVYYRGYNALYIYCTDSLKDAQFCITVEYNGYVTLDDNFISSHIARTDVATQESDGLMSAEDKIKLDSIQESEYAIKVVDEIPTTQEEGCIYFVRKADDA